MDVLYQLSYLGKSIFLLSVRDFTLGVGDCQAGDAASASHLLRLDLSFVWIYLARWNNSTPMVRRTLVRFSLDLNLLRYYNLCLL